MLTNDPLSNLPEPFRSALLSMYRGEPQTGPDGARHSLDAITKIDRNQGLWLRDLCRETKPKATLEIGLAYGFSLIYFLAAIHENGTGHHTAVDPFQNDYGGIGRSWPHILGMQDRFRLIEEKSFPALAHLADKDETFEVIFIDGNHRFDDVIVDFTLAAELCPIDGTIVMDDMWMPSIRMATSFIRSNRKDFRAVRTPIPNIGVFRRIDQDRRPWNHFIRFFNDYYLHRAIDRLMA